MCDRNLSQSLLPGYLARMVDRRICTLVAEPVLISALCPAKFNTCSPYLVCRCVSETGEERQKPSWDRGACLVFEDNRIELGKGLDLIKEPGQQ